MAEHTDGAIGAVLDDPVAFTELSKIVKHVERRRRIDLEMHIKAGLQS